MLFTLEPLQAAEGDCLLLHWGSAADPKLALIDGGPGRTYENTLRPRLEEILANRGLNRLPIEIAMVSHVDNDHIVGVKKLFRALKSEIDSNVPAVNRLMDVKRLWHNTFNDVLGDAIDRYYRTLTASLQASIGGAPNPAMVAALAEQFRLRHNEPADEALEDARDVALVLAGHGEGRDLRDDHKFVFDHQATRALNAPFTTSAGQPALITSRRGADTKVTVAGLAVQVVGPRKEEIEALQKEFDDFIQDRGLTAEAVLAAYADKSVKNLSSIVCIASLGGRRILLTGDARGDKVIAGLEDANLFDANGALHVDVLKVPHHGSDRNVAPAFFERITADTYVLSGDGKHGNPDRDTVQWITDARGPDAEYRLVMTYPVDETDAERKRDFEKKNRTWRAGRDSLSAFFASAESDGHKFTVDAGAEMLIELGDEQIDW